MNIKYFFLLILLFCFSQDLIAQKAKSKTISFEYTGYPAVSIPDDYKSFVLTTSGEIGKKKYILNKLKELSVGSLKRVEEATEADIEIQLRGGDIYEIGARIIKQNDGMIRKEITFKCPLSFNIFLAADRKFIYKSEISSITDTLRFLTTPFTNEAQMQLLMKEDDFKRGIYNEIVKLITANFEKFDSNHQKVSFPLFMAKGKKLDYDKLNDAVKTIKQTIFDQDVTQTLSREKISQLQSLIAVLNGELDNADTTNSSARVNKEIWTALNFNLAYCHLWVHDFNKAWKHLRLAKDLDDRYRQPFEDFLSEYQHRYLHNKQEINLNDQMAGTWRLVAMSGTAGDFNKDGNYSTDLLNHEVSPCFKQVKIKFEANQRGQYYAYNLPACQEDVQSIFWKLKRNPNFSDIALGWGDYYSDTEKYIDILMPVEFFSNNKLVLKAELALDPESDTTSEVLLTFSKEE